MPGMGGDEENVGSRGCALLFQGRIWRGEAELSCERIRHLRRLAELTPTAPSPPGLPGGDKPGRGKGDKQGFRGVPDGCRDGDNARGAGVCGAGAALAAAAAACCNF